MAGRRRSFTHAALREPRMGSTRIASANCALIPNRALHTWQIIVRSCVNNRICCSSQNPSSRSRSASSGAANNCLIRHRVPGRTSDNGQTNASGCSSTPISPVLISLTRREPSGPERDWQAGSPILMTFVKVNRCTRVMEGESCFPNRLPQSCSNRLAPIVLPQSFCRRCVGVSPSLKPLFARCPLDAMDHG
jgi:hypothetical protein